jgi:hypothetical protein
MRLSRLRHRPSPFGHFVCHEDRHARLTRLLLTATLLLALAVNPIGAVIHAWGHLAPVSAGYGKSLHHGNGVCELCAAYAALEHTAPAVPLLIQGIAPESPALLRLDSGPPATRLFHYYQRAPPAAAA